MVDVTFLDSFQLSWASMGSIDFLHFKALPPMHECLIGLTAAIAASAGTPAAAARKTPATSKSG